VSTRSQRNCGEKWNIKIVDDIPTLCGMVDAILLESVDGRTHLEQVKPVLAAKKPVYIDKPLAASYKDAKEITRLAQQAGRPLVQHLRLAFLGGNSAFEEFGWPRGGYGRVHGVRPFSHRAAPSRSDVVWHSWCGDALHADGRWM